MDPQSFERAEENFHTAVTMPPAERRYLDEAGGADQQLRQGRAAARRDMPGASARSAAVCVRGGGGLSQLAVPAIDTLVVGK